MSEEIRVGDRVRLDDGREGTIVSFDGRRVSSAGVQSGSARIRLDDGEEVDAGSSRITPIPS